MPAAIAHDAPAVTWQTLRDSAMPIVRIIYIYITEAP